MVTPEVQRLTAPTNFQMSTPDNDCPVQITPRPTNLEAARVALCQLKQFNRRPSTQWTAKELAALKKTIPVDPSDWAVISAYYNAELPEGKNYRRRDIQTLLNNWPSEVDRARQFVGTVKQAPKKDYSKF